MRLLCIPITACLLMLSIALQAQNNAIKINVLSPMTNTLNLQYERVLNATGSLQVGFFYTWFDPADTKFNGFCLTPEYRFFVSETEAPEGVYIAPFLRYMSLDLKVASPDGEGHFSAFGGGVIIGKQWNFKKKIVLDMFLGPAYYSSDTDVKSGDKDDFDTELFENFRLRAGICLGIRF